MRILFTALASQLFVATIAHAQLEKMRSVKRGA